METTMATTPTRSDEETIVEPAPFETPDDVPEVPDGLADDPVTDAVAPALAAAGVEYGSVLSEASWEMSPGTVTGDPSGLDAPLPASSMPGLAANRRRVYRTLVITSSCAQEGTDARSIESPHVYADVPIVLLSVYISIVAKEVLLEIMAGIILATLVAAGNAFGGLTIPNMPLAQ